MLVVVGVTVLSTLAMVIYPCIMLALGPSPQSAGVFLGGTIHDVTQVVAAGMMLGPQAGDTATVVKLFRVMLLMPVVLFIVIGYRNHLEVKVSNEPGKLIPGFMLAIIVLVLLATVGVIRPPMIKFTGDVSRGLLVTAIAAADIKTSFEDLATLGWQPVLMQVGETLFIAAFVFAGTVAFSLGAT